MVANVIAVSLPRSVKVEPGMSFSLTRTVFM